MNKFWQVTRYEYTRHVLRRRFLFALLSVPAVMILILVVGALAVAMSSDNSPIGYVDHAGILAHAKYPPAASRFDKPVEIIAMPTEALAQASLDSGDIQAYYVIAADYGQTSNAELVYRRQPDTAVQVDFRNFMIYNLLSDQPRAIVERIIEGPQLTVQTADGSRSMAQDEWFVILAPITAGLMFLFAISSTSGYLMQAVVEEKENRTMEILITSVSAFQLMGGKIIGLVAVGLTQLAVWTGVAVLGLLIGRNFIPDLASLRMAPGMFGWITAIMLPGFFMVAALMAAVGATVGDAREGQQLAGIFTIPIMLPFWFMYPLLNNPNGPLAIGLSYFPLTGPITLAIRVGFASIPTGLLILNIMALVLYAVGALWLAGRAFRIGMLRYGQRVRWRELFGKMEQS